MTLVFDFARSGRGGPGGGLSQGFIAKSYTTVCPWILTCGSGVKRLLGGLVDPVSWGIGPG